MKYNFYGKGRNIVSFLIPLFLEKNEMRCWLLNSVSGIYMPLIVGKQRGDIDRKVG